MDNEKIERLKALSQKQEPLVAVTVRFPKSVDQKIRDFCAKNQGITRSVVLRECVERGWEATNSEGTEES